MSRSYNYLKFLLSLPLFCLAFLAQGQIFNPVKWNTSWKHIEGDKFELIFTATIDKNWNVYSMYLPSEDGPIATSLNFDEGSHFKLDGKAREAGKKKEGYDAIFEMNLIKFADKYTITQPLKVSDVSKSIVGYLNFMTCDDEQCLPPMDVDFNFKLSKSEGSGSPDGQDSGSMGSLSPDEKKDNQTISTEISLDAGSRNAESASDDEGFLKPAKWKGTTRKLSDKQIEITFTVDLDKGWHVYSQYMDKDDGPIPTLFEFDDNSNILKMSEFEESGEKRVEEFDSFFNMNLVKFKTAGKFTGLMDVKEMSGIITGYLEFMVCNDKQCLPPTPLEFKLDLTTGTLTIEGQEPLLGIGKTKGEGTPVYSEFDYAQANSSCDGTTEEETESQNWFWIFLLGFGGGLLAILTPCVFPMIPLTVSYFTKSSTTKAKGIRNAVTYGLSIIVIYLLLGLLITGIFGADALNLLSTNAWFNIFFGILFIVFAISFFGYFEITLPSSWTNSADKASEKGGLIGIFFMAFTLSLVSFSCTGPIIGTLLVETATGGGATLFGWIPVGPLVGMGGFAFALALPFGLFAAFPSWLNSLPRSGSWMNSVKVTLGFVEVALALKFFSVADLTMGWKFLPYELFVALWVLCAVGLAMYFFGFIKFPHDSPVRSLSNPRKILAFSMVALAVYFAFGFRYSEKSGTFSTPNMLSGLAPPAGHSYIYPKKCPLNLNCFKDFDEGMAFARKSGKPVMLDFTGHGCVNCRRMEDQVWGKEGIYEKLRDDFVVISLYVDERKALEEPYISAFSGKTMRNVGNKWADFQAIHFNRNSQPYYVILDTEQQILNTPVAYVSESEYRSFLDCGLSRFKAAKN